MNRFSFFLCILLLCHSQGLFAQEVFRYGVAPWTNLKLLQSWASPIKNSLEKQLKNPVQITSAADVGAYLQKAIDLKMDAFQVPSHLAVYLIDEHGFQPVIYVEGRSQVLLVGSARSQFQGLKQASEGQVLLGGPLTITTQVGKKWFRDAGLVPQYVYKKDQWKVMDELFSGSNKVGVVMSVMFESLTPVLKSKLIEIKRSVFFVNGMLLAVPSLDSNTVKKLQQGFLSVKSDEHYFLMSAHIPTEKHMNKMRNVISPYYSETVSEINKQLNVRDKLK